MSEVAEDDDHTEDAAGELLPELDLASAEPPAEGGRGLGGTTAARDGEVEEGPGPGPGRTAEDAPRAQAGGEGCRPDPLPPLPPLEDEAGGPGTG